MNASRRTFLRAAGTTAAATALTSFSLPAEAQSKLRLQRLGWAGLRIDLGDTTVFVDATHNGVEDGAPDTAVVTDVKNHAAMITHHHADHLPTIGAEDREWRERAWASVGHSRGVWSL